MKNKTIPAKAARFLTHGKNGHGGRNGADEPASKAELEAAIQRYVDLFDFAPVGYISFDRVGRIEEINVAAARLLGLPRRQLIGSALASRVVKTDMQLFLHHLLRCRASETRIDTELQLKKQSGELVLVGLSSSPMISSDAHGVPLYQTAIVDLTERKKSEEATRQSELRYRTLFDFVPAAVYTCKANGLILEFNQQAAELWGRKPKTNDPTEKYCGSFKIFYPDGRPMPHKDCPMARVLRGENVPTNEREILVERENGERRIVAVSPTALRNERGKIIGAINCLYDVTESKQAAKSLVEAAEQRDTMYRFVERRQDAKTLEDICAAALDATLSALRCDRASILLSDREGVMRFVGWHRLSRRYRTAVDGHSPWSPSEKKPRPVYVPDIDTARIAKSLKTKIKAEGIRAAAFIPLEAEGKLIGKLVIYYDAPHGFTPKERNLALNIATQLALGVERKRAESALRESEELHRALVRQTAVGMARSDLKGRLVFVNRKFCDMLGYRESELIGKTILEITHPDHAAESKRLFLRIVREGKPYYLEKRYRRKDGSYLWVGVSASPMRDANGKTQSAVAVIVDISDQKKAEVLLKERTRNLEGEILEISDREQRRLGQDIHDSLCQHLAAIAFMARSTALRLKNHRVIEVEDIEKIAELINEGVSEAGTIARGLHPVEMDSAGLTTALQSLLHWQSRLPYRLDIDEEISISDPTVAVHLYRIAREAVINANKHARARELIVQVQRLPRQIELSVTDDGIGIGKNRNGGGLGFHIMDYRARSIGARLEITQIKPHGTRVACYVPRK